MPEHFESGRKYDGKKAVARFLMPKKGIYTLRIDQSHTKSVDKCLVFITLERSHDAVSKTCLLEFRFQK